MVQVGVHADSCRRYFLQKGQCNAFLSIRVKRHLAGE